MARQRLDTLADKAGSPADGAAGVVDVGDKRAYSCEAIVDYLQYHNIGKWRQLARQRLPYDRRAGEMQRAIYHYRACQPEDNVRTTLHSIPLLTHLSSCRRRTLA